MFKKLVFALVFTLVSTKGFALTDNEAQKAISYFYTHYVFGGHDLDKNSKLGTKRFLGKLQQLYEYGCETTCYATNALRTSFQDGLDGDEHTKLLSIIPRGKGWYRVSYKDMGHSGVTDVKLIKTGNTVQIDDFKQISEKVTSELSH